MNPQDLLSTNIISLLGLESLSDEEKQSIIDKASELVQKRLILRLMDQLTDEQSAKLDSLAGNATDVYAYIAEIMPNFEEVVNEEIVAVKEQMLNVADPF